MLEITQCVTDVADWEVQFLACLLALGPPPTKVWRGHNPPVLWVNGLRFRVQVQEWHASMCSGPVDYASWWVGYKNYLWENGYGSGPRS